MDCTIGVDVGATKTHLRVMEGNRILDDKIVSSQDWRCFDWGRDAQSLAAMIAELDTQSRLGAARLGAVCVGASGCDEQAECDAFHLELQQRLACPVKVVNDSELIPPAIGFFDAIGVVCGTGSIAVTRNHQGEMMTAGGWGWVIGDEGSASGLMREAGRITSLHLDLGGRRDDPLIGMLCQCLGIDSPVKIGVAIHTSGSSANLGQHAPVIFEAAKQGSNLARQVLEEGVMALVELVQRLIDRGATARHVVAGGSVITHQQDYANLFIEHFDKCFQGRLQSHICHHPPVQGACALAERLIFLHKTGVKDYALS